jgi:hypothetical protein
MPLKKETVNSVGMYESRETWWNVPRQHLENAFLSSPLGSYSDVEADNMGAVNAVERGGPARCRADWPEVSRRAGIAVEDNGAVNLSAGTRDIIRIPI